METDLITKWLGGWAGEINIASVILKTVIVIIMATILGCDRTQNRHTAGLRTLIILSVGSLFAGIADLYFIQVLGANFSFMSAAVLIAIAIASTNTIVFSSKNQIKGFTTSIGIWTMSIISVILGLGFYTGAIVGFIALMIGFFAFIKPENLFKNRSNLFEIHLELKSRNGLQEFISIVREFGLRIDNIELNPAFSNSGLAVYSVRLDIINKELKKKTHDEILQALSALECVNYVEII